MLDHPVLFVFVLLLGVWYAGGKIGPVLTRHPGVAVFGLVVDGVFAVVFALLWLVPPVAHGWTVALGFSLLSLAFDVWLLRRARKVTAARKVTV